jgi:hypothetical protein
MGDLGRADRDTFHDEVMPAIGNAISKGSAFNLADQEIEMRDRVWRYLVAPHAYDWFGDVAVEFQRTRIQPISNKPFKTRKYYDWLHGERFASSRVRYSRIEEDAITDLGMMPSAFASVCAVIDWFARSVSYRYESYSYALDHLLVETPHEEAVSANARLADLAVWVEAALRGDFCSDLSLRGGRGDVVIQSRVLRSAPDEGPYRK